MILAPVLLLLVLDPFLTFKANSFTTTSTGYKKRRLFPSDTGIVHGAPALSTLSTLSQRFACPPRHFFAYTSGHRFASSIPVNCPRMNGDSQKLFKHVSNPALRRVHLFSSVKCWWHLPPYLTMTRDSHDRNNNKIKMLVGKLAKGEVEILQNSKKNWFSEEENEEQGDRDDDEVYGIGSLNMSTIWADLVRNGKVEASLAISEEEGLNVRYGVRCHRHGQGRGYEEFVQLVNNDSCEGCGRDGIDGENDAVEGGEGVNGSVSFVRSINSTLEEIQGEQRQTKGWGGGVGGSGGTRFAINGPYCAQLQLVRTLRPPPSKSFDSSSSSLSLSSVPPPYDPSSDSFLVGDLKLENRPLVGRIEVPTSKTVNDHSESSCRCWDVYHNVSPCDVRGHFLLLPSIADSENHRGQTLTSLDCIDLCHLSSMVRPSGSLLICFNSVNAGASQNHIHCHAWPNPPPPLIRLRRTYPVMTAKAVPAGADVPKPLISLRLNNDEQPSSRTEFVEISLLDYPCCCIKFSTRLPSKDRVNKDQGKSPCDASSSAHRNQLHLMGEALSMTLFSIGDSPYNVCATNRQFQGNKGYDDDEKEGNRGERVEESHGSQYGHGNGNGNGSGSVEVYLFVRSHERSARTLPDLKLGSSEMMGVFHCQSEQQLTEGTNMQSDFNRTMTTNALEMALEDVSVKPSKEAMWKRIVETLEQTFLEVEEDSGNPGTHLP